MKLCLAPLTLCTTWLVVASTANGAGLYTQGHGDLRPYYEGGQLQLRYQLDGNAVVDGVSVDPINEATPASYELTQLVTYVPDPPLDFPTELLEAQPELALLGIGAGGPVWIIPQTQEYDRAWFGLSSEELSSSDWQHPVTSAPGMLEFTLISVSGPAGGFFSFMDNVDFGNPTAIHFATFDGIDSSDTYGSGFSTETHAHTNWVFTQPGIYDITLKFSGDHLTDGYQEAIGTLRFAVAVPVPEPTSTLLFLIGGIGMVAAGRHRRRKPNNNAYDA